MSDASCDRTDEIVRGYVDQGVELLRLAERGGKTARRERGGRHLRGDIVINTDASIRIAPGSFKGWSGTSRTPRWGWPPGGT